MHYEKIDELDYTYIRRKTHKIEVLSIYYLFQMRVIGLYNEKNNTQVLSTREITSNRK